jgi:ATP-binding cassette subfamily B protein
MVSHPHMSEPKRPLSSHGWILGYLMREKAVFVPSLVALMVTAVLSLAFPYFLGKLVGSPADALKNQIDPQKVLAESNRVVLQLLGVLALQAVVGFFRVQGFIRSGEAALNALRRDLFDHLLKLPMSFFHEQRAGVLSNRVSSDLGVVRDTLIQTVPQAVRQTVILIGGLAFIFVASWKLSLLMLGSVPFVVLAVALFGRKVRGRSRAAQDALAEAGSVIEESVQGIADVKAFTNEGFEAQRYGRSLEKFYEVTCRGARTRAAFLAFVIFALFGTIAFVTWYGARMLATEQITQLNFVYFILFSIFVGASLGSIPEIFSQFQQTTGALDRLRELREMGTERAGGEAVGRLDGAVALDGVSFRYPSRPDVRVLQEVSFAVEPGTRVALVGPSGAGKSTVFSLLLGFHEPESGRVMFDGRDAVGLDQTELRSQIAVVPQEVLLFGGTIRENIAYGRTSATEEEIVEAAKLANADAFIRELPEGYDTVVGPRGTKLSGGQRQRVAIARAVLADPRILLLDEATSALDAESERLVNEALERLMKGRTCLVIAHRLSTVRHADRILVFQAGRIVESGSHEELLEKQGTYRLLVETQLV